MVNEIDKFVYAALRIAYTGITCVNANFKSFKEWLKEIEDINTNDLWIVEVTELAVAKFCGPRIIQKVK